MKPHYIPRIGPVVMVTGQKKIRIAQKNDPFLVKRNLNKLFPHLAIGLDLSTVRWSPSSRAIFWHCFCCAFLAILFAPSYPYIYIFHHHIVIFSHFPSRMACQKTISVTKHFQPDGDGKKTEVTKFASIFVGFGHLFDT